MADMASRDHAIAVIFEDDPKLDAPPPVVPQVPGREVKIRIYLRTIGIFIVAAFLAAMILGGILTFTVTRYTAENDKIYAFYDTFNLCIFFDHYPASLGSLLGLVIVCSASILYR